MKATILFTFLTLGNIGLTMGQVNESKNIRKISDSVIDVKIIGNDSQVAEQAHFLVNTIIQQPDFVKLLGNKTGVNAYTKNLNYSGISSLNDYLKNGNIKFFIKGSATHNPVYYNSATGAYYGGVGTLIFKNNSTQSFGDFKKTEYPNLNLNYNPEVNYLNTYKSTSNGRIGLQIIGGTSILAGLVMIILNNRNSENYNQSDFYFPMGIVLMGFGAGCFWLSKSL